MGYEAGKVVMDTDVLIDYLRGKNPAVEVVRRLAEQGAELATTAVNVFELSWGAARLGRMREVEDLVEALTVLDLTVKEALKAGEEIAYLSSIGLTVEIRDVLIGVIARENGYTLLTGNTRHFKVLRGLEVVPYRR